MKILAFYLLLLIGFIILGYYIYLLFVGKSLARLVGSKDRYIWNGLRNVTDKASRGRATIFLDESQLVISTLPLTSVYSKLKSGSLDEGIAIAFEDIAEFDYDTKGIPFLSPLINRIFKINDFNLKLSYYNDVGQLQSLRFKAASMDPLDFEASFADFNNKIYGSKGLRRNIGMVNNTAPPPVYKTETTSPKASLEEKTELVKAGSFDEPLPVSEGVDKTEVLKPEELKEILEGLPRDTEEEKTQIIKLDELVSIPSSELEEVPEEAKTVEAKETEELVEEAVPTEKTELVDPGIFKEEPAPTEKSELTEATNSKEEPVPTEKTELVDPGIFKEEPAPAEKLEQTEAASPIEEAPAILEKTELVATDKFKAEPKEVEPEKTTPPKPKKERRSIFSKKTAEVKKENPEKAKVVDTTDTITRRSFLDKGPKKKDGPGKTTGLELPDELKRVDTTGLSKSEIDEKELERIEKLKEFFSEQRKD